MTMFDDIEGDERNFIHYSNEYPLGTFMLKVELGNAAMSELDDLANALELVATQVRNRMEYPRPIVDANGNTCGEWTVIPYDEPKYEIRHYYKEEGKPFEVIETDVSYETALEHCDREDTKDPNGEWFDGWVRKY